MRTIDCAEIRAAVSQLCIEANLHLPEDVCQEIDRMAAEEERPLCQTMLRQMQENRRVAMESGLALCQDTGSAVIFVELGQDVHISGGSLNEAIHTGVAEGYQRGYLRRSIVTALGRVNTGDNTPAIIHLDLVPGEQLRITIAPKGGGAENMSAAAMLKPAVGIKGVADFVVDTVRKAGANPCPPVVVGVGVGGNFETAPLLAKKALLRSIGSNNPDPQAAELEQTLLERINQLGIGIMGFGGKHTALAVFVETMPCHFASLPVAVNLNCHVARHQTALL